MKLKHIYFTVTNDLTYDQRMHRICTSLSHAGFKIILVGRKLPASRPLENEPYVQKRLRCFFNKGFLFYAEYNLRLFLFLLPRKMDGLCAVDLDTILPCLVASKLKRIVRIYDAHEYFTELKEVRMRPRVQRFWTAVERFAVPQFRNGYTVTEGLAAAFKKRYNRRYNVIRNLPVLLPPATDRERKKILVYQGAVNEGRGFEVLIPAMKTVPYKLVVCGDGNFMTQVKNLIRENGVEEKVALNGMMLPADLRLTAREASLGIGLAEKEGINQYHALPNKFLDYMHAGLPQLAMNFPEYKRINEQYRVAVLLDGLSVELVAKTINETMADENRLKTMAENALAAREIFCWQHEEKVLIRFYKNLFA